MTCLDLSKPDTCVSQKACFLFFIFFILQVRIRPRRETQKRQRSHSPVAVTACGNSLLSLPLMVWCRRGERHALTSVIYTVWHIGILFMFSKCHFCYVMLCHLVHLKVVNCREEQSGIMTHKYNSCNNWNLLYVPSRYRHLIIYNNMFGSKHVE